MSIAEPPPAQNGRHIGRAMKRKEDPRLITGRASYTDDIVLPGLLHAAIVRSPEAHARIVSIDTEAAKALPGRPRRPHRRRPRARGGPAAGLGAAGRRDQRPRALAAGQGAGQARRDAVAWSSATTVCRGRRRGAGPGRVRAAPVVIDPEKALEEGSPLVHEQFGTNRSHEWSLGGGDLEAGFAEADVIVERRVVNHRISGAPIEPRGVLADYKAGAITVHSSTQVPHFVRLFMAIILGINEERVRIIAPEVGGGFGAKLQVTGEEILCAWASRKTGRPVKWVETRSEHMAVTHHGRDQVATIRIGAKRDGTLTALHAKILADMGAYLMLLTPTIPSLGAFVMGGVYKIPAVQTDITGVFTNKVATDAIRGAGRPRPRT
jgi:carbon-monoxide dehydrogenase large subunit